MLNMDPSKKSYASIEALDLTENTSLPLNPQLRYLLLTQLGITAFQVYKAALSYPDTLTYDQVLLDPDIEEWKKSAHKEITQLESKDNGLKFELQKPLPKFFHVNGYFVARELLQESSPSSRHDIMTEVTYKKTYQKPMHQLSHGVQSALYLSSPLHKNGISSVWTSTMPLSKTTSRIQYGYIFAEDTNPSQPQLHASNSRKVSMVSLLHSSSGNQYLQEGLIEDNFQQSAHDECVFIKNNMIIFLYVDDCGIASPDMSEIHALH